MRFHRQGFSAQMSACTHPYLLGTQNHKSLQGNWRHFPGRLRFLGRLTLDLCLALLFLPGECPPHSRRQAAVPPPPCSNLSKPPSPGSLLDPPTRMGWLLLLGAHLWIPSLTCLVPAMPVLRADAHRLRAGLTHVKKECAHVCGWC